MEVIRIRTPGSFTGLMYSGYTPEGGVQSKSMRSVSRGFAVEAINLIGGQLWCSTNERDNLGNHLVPDYVTSVKEDGFYGWPWYYIGDHFRTRDFPSHARMARDQILAGTGVDAGTGRELQARGYRFHGDRARCCLCSAHMASLEMLFFIHPAATFLRHLMATPLLLSTGRGTARNVPATKSSTSQCTMVTLQTEVMKTFLPA